MSCSCPKAGLAKKPVWRHVKRHTGEPKDLQVLSLAGVRIANSRVVVDVKGTFYKTREVWHEYERTSTYVRKASSSGGLCTVKTRFAEPGRPGFSSLGREHNLGSVRKSTEGTSEAITITRPHAIFWYIKELAGMKRGRGIATLETDGAGAIAIDVDTIDDVLLELDGRATLVASLADSSLQIKNSSPPLEVRLMRAHFERAANSRLLQQGTTSSEDP